MDLVKTAIEFMGKGMLAVFLVSFIIIIFVWLLTGGGIKNMIARSKAKQQAKKQKKNNPNS
jgi:Na+-transporting methylmalonyl-CoA/oxaloacetate decarboxylase gamma subunit